MSEESVTYDAGDTMYVRVDGGVCEMALVAIDLESVWCALEGDRVCGEMTVTFRDGRATCVSVKREHKLV